MSDANKTNLLVWSDIPVVDLDRAMKFYETVLARGVLKVEMPGCTFAVMNHENGSGACLVPSGENAKPSATGPLLYLNVEGRLDAAEAEVTKMGGKVLQAKHVIGPHGSRTVILDSEGNRIALHSH